MDFSVPNSLLIAYLAYLFKGNRRFFQNKSGVLSNKSPDLFYKSPDLFYKSVHFFMKTNLWFSSKIVLIKGALFGLFIYLFICSKKVCVLLRK